MCCCLLRCSGAPNSLYIIQAPGNKVICESPLFWHKHKGGASSEWSTDCGFPAHLLEEALRWLLIIEVESSVQGFSGSRHTQLLGRVCHRAWAGSAALGTRPGSPRGAWALNAENLRTEWVQLHQGLGQGSGQAVSPLSLHNHPWRWESCRNAARAEWCPGTVGTNAPCGAGAPRSRPGRSEGPLQRAKHFLSSPNWCPDI